MLDKLSAALATTAVAGALTVAAVAGAPAAMASGNCDPGSYYRVASHKAQFVKVESVQYVNKTSTTFTGHFDVSQSHTNTWTKSASITASVEAGFWGFAKASASTTVTGTLAKTSTMTTTYGGSVSVPAHQTYQIDFGFNRLSQTIQKYHLVQTQARARSTSTSGTIVAPYAKAFRSSKVG